ncbi:hypothetical protein GCM10011363_18650 [Marivita lacus]|uniref:Uncharacterized protein n=1 Tax=Marivita lacus TaxID=1323742 RepID=A0ABQ1KME9_9RHOB|nr:DUF6525 family protein [Marivita lacus]GGC02334.1 hypothetical protein GCM10011363_18650 [Marivita lacus]
MPTNRGTTSLKLKRRAGNPMRDYDGLPCELRNWLATAVLPWRPASARRVFDRAMARTADPAHALDELDRLQARLVAKDVGRIWGPDHPLLSQSYSARQVYYPTV